MNIKQRLCPSCGDDAASVAVSEAANVYLNRRALLVGAGGLVAVGVAGSGAITLPARQSYSPEFVEYHRRMMDHVLFCDGPDAIDPPFGSPEAVARDAQVERLCELRSEARMPIQNRPVRSRQDRELLLLVRYGLFQLDSDGVWRAHSYSEELTNG